VDHEQDSTGTPDVSRVQNQLHLLPEDWSAVGAVIEPLFERLDSSVAAAQLLVVTSDSEAAAGVAAGIASSSPGEWRVLGATDARRAVRIQRSTPAQIVVGSPGVLIELIQATALKLDAVRCVVLAWVDDLDGAATRALEALMTDLSKDSMRVVIAGGSTSAVEQLVERYARRARRVQASGSEPTPPVSLAYVAATEAGRLTALRRLPDPRRPAA
jgi:superfamily II DNA/RNA helicase